MLSACASEEDEATRKSVQDQELQLPIDACIRHASGDTNVQADLVAAGYRSEGGGKFRREFSDLDNALSAQGAVDVTLSTDCTLFIPIHVAVLDELDMRIRARLSALGYIAAGDGGSPRNPVAYVKGDARLAYEGFARSYALLGWASTIRFNSL